MNILSGAIHTQNEKRCIIYFVYFVIVIKNKRKNNKCYIVPIIIRTKCCYPNYLSFFTFLHYKFKIHMISEANQSQDTFYLNNSHNSLL